MYAAGKKRFTKILNSVRIIFIVLINPTVKIYYILHLPIEILCVLKSEHKSKQLSCSKWCSFGGKSRTISVKIVIATFGFSSFPPSLLSSFL